MPIPNKWFAQYLLAKTAMGDTLAARNIVPAYKMLRNLLIVSGAIVKIKILLSLVVIAALVGCATRPESISASYISHEKYAGLSCEQLTTQMVDARASLQKFSEMQNSKANIDAASVFLVLIPASKLTGDSAGDVAKWKGEVEAVDTAQIRAGCKRVS